MVETRQPNREWSAVTPHREVEPMITTKWGQQAPYNGKCPMYQGKRSVTGCTGVALAQVLNYHRGNTPNSFVMEYVDPESGADISVDYSQATYNWDLIRDTYEERTYTPAEAEEVAKLVYEAGVACKCEYSNQTTSGKWPLVALDRFFNYNSKPLMRTYLPTQYCMQTRARHLHLTHRRSEPPSPQDRDIIIAALKEPGSEDFIALEPGEV